MSSEYKWYWLCKTISAFGSRIQSAAIIWYMYGYTESIFVLTFLAIVESVPSLLFSVKAGQLVDRYRHINFFKISHIAAVGVSALLWVCFLIDMLPVWLVVGILFFQNSIDVLAGPASMLAVGNMVAKDGLGDAINYNGLMKSTSKIFGPPLAGLLLSLSGPVWCFFLNMCSFIPLVVFSIVGVSCYKFDGVLDNLSTGESTSFIEDVRFFVSNKNIVFLMVMLLIINATMFNYNIIVPIIAEEILNVGSVRYSMLFMFNGFGNMIGVAVYKKVKRVKSRRFILWLAIGIVICYFGIAVSGIYVVTSLIFVVTGAVNSVFQTMVNANVQTQVCSQYRGRITGVYDFVGSGISPFAKIQISIMIYFFGASVGMMVQAICTLVMMGIVYWFAIRISENSN